MSVYELSAYCTHSVALPFCMYSAIHLTSWSFSFSSCNKAHQTNTGFYFYLVLKHINEIRSIIRIDDLSEKTNFVEIC